MMAKYLCEEDMNTGEYISRDEALKIFHQCCDNCTSSYNGVMCRACADADAMDILIDIPAIDVQPIKHGRWMTSHPVDIAKEFKCTACGGLVELPVFAKKCYYDFCPNCGARMDGDTNG